jgi:putative sterol carrier protein
MMQFWSQDFFSAAASSLNADPRLSGTITGIATTITADCSDRKESFLISVDNGRVAVRSSLPGEPSEFSFSAPYEEWVRIVRDTLDIRGEVLKGRVKFRGSMPKMLLYLGRVSKMEKEIIAKMRAMGPEY